MEEYRAELRERAEEALRKAGLPLSPYEPTWGIVRRKLEVYYMHLVDQDLNIIKAYYRSKA